MDVPPVPVLDGLSEREQELVDAARSGRELVCGDLGTDALGVSDAEGHQVRAELVRELLLGRRGPLDPRGVRLRGARIVGKLDLEHVSADVGVQLAHCVVAEGLTADDARLPWLNLSGSRLRALSATRMHVNGHLLLRELKISSATEAGAVRLISAHIGGQLVLDDAEITNDLGPALHADGLQADSYVPLQRARLSGAGDTGTILLHSARIGGQLVLHDAEVTNSTGPALVADDLQADSSVRLCRARLSGAGEDGAIRLLGARVSGHLLLDGAEVTNNGGPALYADQFHTGGSVRLDSARLLGAGDLGAVRMVGARVGGQLVMVDAKVTNGTGDTIVLEDTTVSRAVFIEAGLVCPTPTGGTSRCPHPGQVSLDAFTFGALAQIEWWEWLHIIRHHTSDYRPRPYQQLAAVERAAGHDGNARRILIAQQQDLHQRAGQSLGGWWTRRFHWLWGALAGYGYRARRIAGALLLTLLVAGALGFWAGQVTAAPRHHVAERTASFGEREGQPCTTVELIAVGLDRGLPLPTDVRTRCDINTDTARGQTFTVAIWVVQAVVWALATLVLAGYTSLIRKTS